MTQPSADPTVLDELIATATARPLQFADFEAVMRPGGMGAALDVFAVRLVVRYLDGALDWDAADVAINNIFRLLIDAPEAEYAREVHQAFDAGECVDPGGDPVTRALLLGEDILPLQLMHAVGLRRDLLHTAASVLRGSVCLTEGVRALCSLASSLHLREEAPFPELRGIDSETDEYPMGQVRAYWNPAALQRLDLERESYEASVRERVMAACREIIATRASWR